MGIFRKAVKDVTLSDGTRIPRGTLVAAAAVTAHSDDARYGPDAHAFDPFRFARLRERGAGAAVKHQLVNTSLDFLPFGHGKHAWCVSRLLTLTPSALTAPRTIHDSPGRFFAANEIKTMMAYLLLNYDIKFAEEGRRPANILFGPANLPSTSAKVLLRKRRLGAGANGRTNSTS